MICNLDKSTPYSGLGKLFKKFFSGKIISSYRITNSSQHYFLTFFVKLYVVDGYPVYQLSRDKKF